MFKKDNYVKVTLASPFFKIRRKLLHLLAYFKNQSSVNEHYEILKMDSIHGQNHKRPDIWEVFSYLQ